MKKLISFVLTAAMVASLVPATAFAGDITATAVPVKAVDFTKEDASKGAVIENSKNVKPELKITLDKVDYQRTSTTAMTFEVELELDNAEWNTADANDPVSEADFAKGDLVDLYNADGTLFGDRNNVTVSVDARDFDKDYAKIVFEFDPSVVKFEKGDYIIVVMDTVLTKASVGTLATVSVDGIAEADDLVIAAVESRGITASTRKLGTVAEEEKAFLSKDLVIESKVGTFAAGQIIELKLSNGFEFSRYNANPVVDGNGNGYQLYDMGEDDILGLEVIGTPDEIKVDAADIEIEATTAKAGATAVITVKATNKAWTAAGQRGPVVTGAPAFAARTTVEVMKVVDYTVMLTVDEDEDMIPIYTGVDVDNTGLTDDHDHWSREITIEETFPGAWSFRKGFDLELPEGVYVTDIEITEVENFFRTDVNGDPVGFVMDNVFAKAYQDGDHVKFEFEKRVFDDVNNELALDEAKVVFKLQLVADPGYALRTNGEVTLKLTGELVDEQEVVIATFAEPYGVTAAQNDLKIDYRYTEIPTEIVITEAEAGLWDKDVATFGFYMDKADVITFEDDPIFTVNEESGMELADAELGDIDDIFGNNDRTPVIMATVDKESDDVAAEIKISGMSLFMQRNIPAGPYDLKGVTTMAAAYNAQPLFAPDCQEDVDGTCAGCTYDAAEEECTVANCGDCFVGQVCDYSSTVKEAFVNVVTAGREADDASFTTVVKVPVGELYLVAGEETVELDVPAYINANGYTMLPVRAVAKALGINNNNVLWDQATKTVTILYGQRIITMQVGASVIYVNGSAIPAASSVEIVDGRTFLGLRDLATALGVTTIDWDAASKTALLNAEFEA